MTTTETRITNDRIAAALAAFRSLLIAGHVTIRDLWQDMGSGPGASMGRVVEVTIFGRPAARDMLLDGLTEVEGPSEIVGNYFVYREWRGRLLTMPLIVLERMGPASNPGEPESAEVSATGDRAPAPEWPRDRDGVVYDPDKPCDVHADQHLGKPCPDHEQRMARVRRHPARMAAHVVGWSKGTNRGRDAARSMTWEPAPLPADADPKPLLDLLLDERFGADRGPAAPIEVIGDDAEQLAAATGRIVVVPGPDAPPDVEATFARYARARALHYFGPKRFQTVDDAREAISYWPGRDMLRDEDVETVAGSLVDPPRVPEPAPIEAGRGRRLLRVLSRVEASR